MSFERLSTSSKNSEDCSVDRDVVDCNAYIIACDYIGHRLTMSNFCWADCPDLPKPDKASLCMRIMGEMLEREYERCFDSMTEALEISPSTAYPTFTTVCDKLFSSGIRWGRIVALYAFGGALSVHCVQQGMPQLVSSIADWVAMYTESRLSLWIATNGGWAGFVDYYDQTPFDQEPSSRQVATGILVVCGVLGLMTFAAFLTAGRG